MYQGKHIKGSPFGPLSVSAPSKWTIESSMLTRSECFKNDKVSIVITAADMNGKTITSGGARVLAAFAFINGHRKSVEAIDNANGTYSVQYVMERAGSVEILLTVGGSVHLAQSPYRAIAVHDAVTMESGASETLSSATLCKQMGKMLASDKRRLILLYNSTRSGYRQSPFNKTVQGKSSLLFVIKHKTTGNVFGAYVAEKFDLSIEDWCVCSPDTFLFRLNGEHPVKLRGDQDFGRVYMSGTQGLVIGGSDKGLCAMHGDLGVGSCGNMDAFCNTAPGYTLPSPLDATTLAGVEEWGGADVIHEIFQCGNEPKVSQSQAASSANDHIGTIAVAHVNNGNVRARPPSKYLY
jgi:hypothetical protein